LKCTGHADHYVSLARLLIKVQEIKNRRLIAHGTCDAGDSERSFHYPHRHRLLKSSYRPERALLLRDQQPCLAQAVGDVLAIRRPPAGCVSPDCFGSNEMGIKPKDMSGLGPRALWFPQMLVRYGQPSSAREAIGRLRVEFTERRHRF
jgi:hypothetical protein